MRLPRNTVNSRSLRDQVFVAKNAYTLIINHVYTICKTYFV